MFTLTKDEFIVLNSKVNSPSMAVLIGDDTAENEAAAAASLAEKKVLEGNSINPDILAILDILDNKPDQKITKIAAPPIPKATGFDAEGGGGDGGGGGGIGFMSFLGSGPMGQLPTMMFGADGGPEVPTDVFAQKGEKVAVIGHTTVKEWAKKYVTYTFDVQPKEKYFDLLKDYLGFVETADSELLRKFTSNVNKKSHEAYMTTMMNRGLGIAVKKYRRGYGLKTIEMYQFNAFLSNMKENFKFRYEFGGKEIHCECLRSGAFQIVSFPSKSLFGGTTKKFCHLGMVKSFFEIQKNAA